MSIIGHPSPKADKPETLLRAQNAVGKRYPGLVPTAPWFDGDLLPASMEAYHQKPPSPVPLLVGINRDDIVTKAKWMPGTSTAPTEHRDIAVLLRAQLGESRATTILDGYRLTRVGERRLASDLMMFMPTLHFAERHAESAPTWFYGFDYANPLLGRVHGIELFYL